MEEIILLTFWFFAPIGIAMAFFMVVYLAMIQLAEFFKWFGKVSDESTHSNDDDL